MIRTPRPIIVLLACLLSVLSMDARADSGLPGVEQSVEAWYVVRGWVTDFALPDAASPAARTGVDDAFACCLILRQSGRVLGVGTATETEGRMLHRATTRALSMALADPALRALPDDIRESIGAKLTVELEITGPMQPLIGHTPAEFQDDIHPLHHGLALRWNEKWSMKFPSRLRGMNRRADVSMLDGMAISLGLGSGLRNALERDGIAAYRFRTIDLAQSQPDAPPQLVVGGTMSQPPALPGVDDLSMARDSLLTHVRSRQWPGEEPLGLVGSYDPSTDQYEPIVAPTLDQAMTAWALGRVANSTSIDRPSRDAARDTAAELLAALLTVEETTPVENAAILLAMQTNGIDHDITMDFPAWWLCEDCDNWDPETAPSGHDLALMSFAMSESPDIHDRALARQLADLAWERTPVTRQVSLMPWIVWTELTLARSGDSMPSSYHQDGHELESLRGLRQLVMERQVPPGDTRFGAELAGGIVLGERPVHVTAKSLRPFAAMPAMYQHEQITTAEDREEQFARLQFAMRFLLQLQVSEADAALYRTPSRVSGGIRMAPWDARMPTSAQVMALVTLSDVIDLLPAKTPEPPPGDGVY
ncbi:MAG: hypothetical protein P8K80_05590 [Phycisphaerales bacterium]|nr:hypothetical protein [Phycisphaerales bacterium]